MDSVSVNFSSENLIRNEKKTLQTMTDPLLCLFLKILINRYIITNLTKLFSLSSFLLFDRKTLAIVGWDYIFKSHCCPTTWLRFWSLLTADYLTDQVYCLQGESPCVPYRLKWYTYFYDKSKINKKQMRSCT